MDRRDYEGIETSRNWPELWNLNQLAGLRLWGIERNQKLFMTSTPPRVVLYLVFYYLFYREIYEHI